MGDPKLVDLEPLKEIVAKKTEGQKPANLKQQKMIKVGVRKNFLFFRRKRKLMGF